MEARDALLKVLDRLPYPDREVLILRHLEELSVEEIAAMLDIGRSAAKMRLKRARERFMAARAPCPVAAGAQRAADRVRKQRPLMGVGLLVGAEGA